MPQSLKAVRCYIKRDKSGFSKKFYPKYLLYLSDSNHFVMAGQKMQIIRSAYYGVTMDQAKVDKKTPGYLGKVRSNLVGTEYSIFDQGESPDKGIPPEQVRCQHGAVIYVSIAGSEPGG